jgi:hypothetical protein
VEIIAEFSMTQKLNKEPCWLLCDEQRFIFWRNFAPNKKEGLRLQQKDFFVGGKKILPNLPYFEEKKDKNRHI